MTYVYGNDIRVLSQHGGSSTVSGWYHSTVRSVWRLKVPPWRQPPIGGTSDLGSSELGTAPSTRPTGLVQQARSRAVPGAVGERATTPGGVL